MFRIIIYKKGFAISQTVIIILILIFLFLIILFLTPLGESTLRFVKNFVDGLLSGIGAIT